MQGTLTPLALCPETREIDLQVGGHDDLRLNLFVDDTLLTCFSYNSGSFGLQLEQTALSEGQ